MRRKSKKLVQQIHFAKRSVERIGVFIDANQLVKDVQAGNLQFYEKQSNRVTKWLYEKNGEKYILVYDKSRKQLITILNYKEL